MLLNSKRYIPEVYAKERDMQVFTTLIDLILTCCKFDIDSLYRLYNALECPQEFLPYLGDTVNYKYDNASSVTTNRKVLDIFMTMMKYKGSEKGLKMATALCLTSLDISRDTLENADTNTDYLNALISIKIYFDYENAKIIIDYPNIYTQVQYLLDYVRPVGMFIDLRSIINIDYPSAPVGILAQATHRISEYTLKHSQVNKAHVNFSSVIDQKEIDKWKSAEEIKQTARAETIEKATTGDTETSVNANIDHNSEAWKQLAEMDIIDFNN